MKVLFATIPGYGHTYPLMPLATACADAGHEVTVATGAPFLGRLPLPTVAGIPAGTELDAVIDETRRRHPDRHGNELSFAMFADTTAELVSGTLDAVLDGQRPDLIVYEALNVGAGIAADVRDIPAVGFAILLAPFVVDTIHTAARQFHAEYWAGHGRAVPPGRGPLAGAVIDPTPPSLLLAEQPPEPVRRLPIRSVAYAENSVAAPEWLTGRRSRPAVYLTLGTVAFGAVEVIRRAVDQIATLDVDLLVAVGPEGNPDALGPVPENVHVELFVSQARVLQAVDLIVHHGGTGTVLGAAAAGLPQLILPQGADHFVNADLIAAAGAGRGLLNDAQVGGAITDAVRALLGQCPERARAARLHEEIAAMPAPAAVVPELERLAAGG
ncbi:MAG TPA: glycosyltransferase [Nakamurella sp.]